MPKPPVIGAAEAAHSLPAWSAVEGRDAIRRTLTFKDFAEAFGFMSEIAILAEKADHHPEWSNVYNRVDILLATHESNGVTQRDLDLAAAIDAAAAKRGQG